MVGFRKNRPIDASIAKELVELRESILREIKEFLVLAVQQNLTSKPDLQQAIEKVIKPSLPPIFIPNIELTNQEIKVNEEEETDSSLNKTAEALRKAKENKNNG